MMGTKIRSFAPLPRDVSLEELVPEDHFYRRLEATLDLSFVRELVGPHYANGGRPSVDPVVFFLPFSTRCPLPRTPVKRPLSLVLSPPARSCARGRRTASRGESRRSRA